ncbi:MAG: hypothetical protein KZQ58_12900 [gamma proteobacterium symbiont of Bathyaustriella thionipta]|nr:hypothetical protein [gamma proteobacterium symbiont of Bathyaustriella thionipta]
MLFFFTQPLLAAEKFKPFVLASNGPGDFVKTIVETKDALKGVGFTLVGEYSPYKDAHIIVVTHPELESLMDEKKGGAYLAPLRATIAKVGNNIQVAYTNPQYFSYAYRVDADLHKFDLMFENALGKIEAFGAEGLTARKLKKYHYTFGMEYFDEPIKVASYDSHEKAVNRIEKNLAKKLKGTQKVYRIDSTSGKVTTFGVGMSKGYAADKTIMDIIDFKELKQLAHLPYELVVRDGDIFMLSGRFRIAITFPDLSMMGDNSFMRITKSPDAIEAVLTAVAGGEFDVPEETGSFF